MPDWYLRHRRAVIDLDSATWRRAKQEVLPPGYRPSECMRRLEHARRVRRLSRGLYLVLDPARETPPIAVASALYSDLEHYVTTDAALAFHGMIDQPLRRITVVVGRRRRQVDLGGAAVTPVTLEPQALSTADAYSSSADGFPIRVASRVQAVVDACAEPLWMELPDLLPEVLTAFGHSELLDAASRTVTRSSAAAQRLGYLLEDAGQSLPPALAGLRPVRSVTLVPGRRSGGYSTRWRVYG